MKKGEGDALRTSYCQGCLSGFFTVWKMPDPDIPIFIAAKAEYAKLK